MTGHTGTSLGDVTALGLVFPASLLLLDALDRWRRSGADEFNGSDTALGEVGCVRRCVQDLPRVALEFTVLVLPSLMAMTALSDCVVELLV